MNLTYENQVCDALTKKLGNEAKAYTVWKRHYNSDEPTSFHVFVFPTSNEPVDYEDHANVLECAVLLLYGAELEVIKDRNGWFGIGHLLTAKVCECGKDKHGFARHLSWCELYV